MIEENILLVFGKICDIIDFKKIFREDEEDESISDEL